MRRALLAASVVLSLGAGLVWREVFHSGTASAAGRPRMREYSAGAGQPIAVTFADGTRVTVAPGSQLRAPTRFEVGSREVRLQGHAYFDVAHDRSRPFTVRTAGAEIGVLGTRFDVLAYPEATGTTVTVRTGRVVVRPEAAPGNPSRVLVGGERGTVVAGGVRVESGVDVEAVVAWTDGTLEFRAAPLRQVVAELERWFEVEIEIADPSLADRRITATFRAEPLDLVLRSVADLVDAKVLRRGRQVQFSDARSEPSSVSAE